MFTRHNKICPKGITSLYKNIKSTNKHKYFTFLSIKKMDWFLSSYFYIDTLRSASA